MPTDAAPRDHILRRFDQIAARVSDACSEIDCTVTEYRLGLKSVIAQLSMDWRATADHHDDDRKEP